MNKDLKISVVDGEKEARDAYEMTLQYLGYSNILSCKTPEDFVKLLPFVHVDVVLSDSALDDAEAKELLSIIKKNNDSKNIKVILVLSKVAKSDKWIRKADIILDKPHKIDKLVEAFNQVEEQQTTMEKRFFKRFHQLNILDVNPISTRYEAIRDVSLSGLSFESKTDFKEGDEMIVHAREWGERDYSPVVGNIVWKKTESGSFVYGLKFKEYRLPVDAP